MRRLAPLRASVLVDRAPGNRAHEPPFWTDIGQERSHPLSVIPAQAGTHASFSKRSWCRSTQLLEGREGTARLSRARRASVATVETCVGTGVRRDDVGGEACVGDDALRRCDRKGRQQLLCLRAGFAGVRRNGSDACRSRRVASRGCRAAPGWHARGQRAHSATVEPGGVLGRSSRRAIAAISCARRQRTDRPCFRQPACAGRGPASCSRRRASSWSASARDPC